MAGEWHIVARVSGLDPEYPSRVKVGDREFAIGLVDGAVFAIANVCSHAFARLSDGHVEGYEIVCPLHGGSFDVRTGEARQEPCEVAINVFETRIDGDEVYLKVPD